MLILRQEFVELFFYVELRIKIRNPDIFRCFIKDFIQYNQLFKLFVITNNSA